jgi:hypothetical protein
MYHAHKLTGENLIPEGQALTLKLHGRGWVGGHKKTLREANLQEGTNGKPRFVAKR